MPAHPFIARPLALRIRQAGLVLAVATSSLLATQALAQSAPQQAYQIPAGPLGRALQEFASQAGITLPIQPNLVDGKQSRGLNASTSVEQGLQQLLSGSGIGMVKQGDGLYVLIQEASGDELELGPVDVSSQQGEALFDQRYRTAGTNHYISQEQIRRFRGSSAGDFLSGIPGVMNAENRNSGALDVNIRGMQGQGRVPVVVDGALQESTVYRGYSGMAGRTYVDPDLIGGVMIEKGPSAAADGTGATGGVVRARTLNAGDIVAPGGNYGLVIRGGLSGNNSEPPAKATVGGSEVAKRNYNRPDLLDMRGRHLSVAYAYRNDLFDVVAAAVRRKSGNYFSGGHGLDSGKWGSNPNRFGFDEQVINTSADNTSYLLRGVLRPTDDHTFDLSWMRYETLHGEMKGSQLMYGDTPYQTTSDIQVDTYTARYRFNPSNDLVDFKADLWRTETDSFVVDPVRLDYGSFLYNGDKFAATLSERQGVTLSNTSRFFGEAGDLSVSYGLAYDHERFGKSDDWEKLNDRYPNRSWDIIREGTRRQYSGFIATTYKPAPWVTFEAATRYLNTKLDDDKVGTSWVQGGLYNSEKASGWAPVFSATIEPWRGIQLYARYAEAMRAPSPFEGSEGFSGSTNPYRDLKPEHAHNTEVGVNYNLSGLFREDDLFEAKVGYFDNDITNYITLGDERLVTPGGNATNMWVLTNIPRVRMRGVELSARYDNGWMFTELSGTQYNDIISCSKEGYAMNDVCQQGIPSTNPSWFRGHIPPEKSIYATLGGRLLDEKLTFGVRYSYIGDNPYQSYHHNYELLDLFASYHIDERNSVDVTVNNLTDRYYIDPLSLGMEIAALPAPGRSMHINFVSRFGDGTWTRKSSAESRAEAIAAGLSDDPMQAFNGNWSGFYLGSHMGISSYDTQGHTTSGNGEPSAVAASERTDRKDKNGHAGLQFGYNHQLANNWVVGFEIDANRTRTNGRQSFIASGLDIDRWGADQVVQAQYRYEYDWGASARLRLGRAIGRYLVYGTGGLALLEENQTRLQNRLVSGIVMRPYFSEKAKEIRSGVVVGGGVEVAFSNKLSLRSEYLYSHYPEKDFKFDRASRDIGAGAVDEPIGRVASNKLEQHSLRLGLNYRF